MQTVDKNQIRIWVVNSSVDETEHLNNNLLSINPNIKVRDFLSYKEAFGVIRNLNRNDLPTIIFSSCTFPGEGNAVDFLSLFNDYYLNIQSDFHIIANNYSVKNMEKVLDNKMVKGWLNKNPSIEALKEIVSKKL